MDLRLLLANVRSQENEMGWPSSWESETVVPISLQRAASIIMPRIKVLHDGRTVLRADRTRWDEGRQTLCCSRHRWTMFPRCWTFNVNTILLLLFTFQIQKNALQNYFLVVYLYMYINTCICCFILLYFSILNLLSVFMFCVCVAWRGYDFTLLCNLVLSNDKQMTLIPWFLYLLLFLCSIFF